MSAKNPYREYWVETVAQSLYEHGVTATNEQIEAIAEDIHGAHSMYGEYFGYHAIPNPLQGEAERLARELQKEKDKVLCEECKGSGRNISYGPCHSFESTCLKCRGDGRHSP